MTDSDRLLMTRGGLGPSYVKSHISQSILTVTSSALKFSEYAAHPDGGHLLGLFHFH